ncbi:hypothetical protein [Halobellus salinisoli]|uniref:hypothetical protein n=1 Tax=Halobellus salinisoli TaxID=3108500 RepID=UPI003008A3D7
MSADGIQSASDSAEETLIECKRTPTFTGIGQLLIYSYLRKRDRDIVRKWYADRGTDWETKREISGFESHIFQYSDGDSLKTYRPKPELKWIDKRLVVCNLDAAAAPILAECHNLGIDVDYLESGRWRTLSPSMFAPSAPEDTSSCESWLATESGETLQSEAEESVAQDFCTLLSDVFGFNDLRTYREIPIGSQLSSSRPSARRADLLVKADDHWFVVEIKRGPPERATRPFLKGLGQAAIYATLFATEWNLSEDKVIPVVCQDPVAIIGDFYRRDRYGEDSRVDYREMIQYAKADMSQPMIIGPAATFGSD